MKERPLLSRCAILGANLVEIIRDTRMEISDGDLLHLIDVATGVETEEVQVQISGKYYYAANIYIPANKEHLIFLRDITAEVEVDRLKDTALAMVSHELSTPLAAIRGYDEMSLRLALHSRIQRDPHFIVHTAPTNYGRKPIIPVTAADRQGQEYFSSDEHRYSLSCCLLPSSTLNAKENNS